MTAREAASGGLAPFLPGGADWAAARPTSSAALNISESQVEGVLRDLPSQGWIGRRDRALLVLSQMACLTFESIAELTVADVTVRDGMAIIRTVGGTTTLRRTADDLICAPCALARWLHALDMTVVYSSCRVSTAVIARAAPLSSNSPHLCQGNVSVTESTRRMALMPSIDQYGPLVDSLVPVAPQRRPVRSPSGRIPSQRVVTTRPSAIPAQEAHRLGIAGPERHDEGAQARGLQGRVHFLLEHRSSASNSADW